MTNPQATTQPFSVSEFVKSSAELIRTNFPTVSVEGELSNVVRSSAGHYYFTLVEGDAQLRCAMFRSNVNRCPLRPEDGMKVIARGKPDIYVARGAFQLVVRALRESGAGELQAKFEALKNKLKAEGLFDPERKRPLPFLPKRIGVVSSARSAAVQDILKVLGQRFPSEVVIGDCLVQGRQAPSSIKQALVRVVQANVDLVILSRGGGSAEDLWAFNDETLARDIAACPVPVLTGVGHEIDTTIADFVADRRAATPSHAAEIAVPDREELRAKLSLASKKLASDVQVQLRQYKLHLAEIERELSDPHRAITRYRSELRAAQDDFSRLTRYKIKEKRGDLKGIQRHIHEHDPRRSVIQTRHQIDTLLVNLKNQLSRRLEESRRSVESVKNDLSIVTTNKLKKARAGLERNAAGIDAMSPLKVLGRGYSIAFDAKGKIIRSIASVNKSESILVRVTDGEINADITSTKDLPQT